VQHGSTYWRCQSLPQAQEVLDRLYAREVSSLSKLEHPNVVQLMAVGQVYPRWVGVCLPCVCLCVCLCVCVLVNVFVCVRVVCVLCVCVCAAEAIYVLTSCDSGGTDAATPLKRMGACRQRQQQ